MPRTAWPTYTDGNAYLTGFGITIGATFDTTFQQRMLDAVVDEFTQYTRRQFVPSATGVTRHFDGSGTGEMEIDDYIDITTVRAIGYLGSLGTGLTFQNVWETDRNAYPKNRLQIYQGSLPAFARTFVDVFPVGRSNIECVGQWGYAAEIPANVWEAIAGEYASRLATLKAYNREGFLEQWREADVGEILKLQPPAQFLPMHQNFLNLKNQYKLSTSKSIRLTQRSIK